MKNQCFMCGYGEEAIADDEVPLCHWCYTAFADVNSPFYVPAFVEKGYWDNVMSDPDAMMWVQQRMEEVQ